jgi:hypothetical protein
MVARPHLLVVLLGAAASMGASFRTTNFLVEAPTPQIAQQFGEAAEHYRREKAYEWLGREMPPWHQPCPLRVTVTMGGPGGATTFAFDQGRILRQDMQIEGPLDRMLASVLPHEITHTVFAYYFRCPVPRWADEGGAVLSEDDLERNRHDQLVRQLLNSGRAFPLRRLWGLRDYPRDVMTLYAQGYSVANYLVAISNRQTFLAFVAHGMSRGWDSAVQAHYRSTSVEELEQAWLTHMRNTRRPPAQLAKNSAPGEPAERVVVRQTVPPAQPVLSPPGVVARGQTPGPEADSAEDPVRRSTPSRPEYLPDYPPPPGSRPNFTRDPQPVAVGNERWRPPQAQLLQPTQPPPPAPPLVQLREPQFGPPVTPPLGRSGSGSASPVGYPH